MPLYWLAYREDRVARVLIVEADALAMARFKADVAVPGMNKHFEEGHELEPTHAALVPQKMIGRTLSPVDASRLIARFERAERRGTKQKPRPKGV